MTSTSADEPVVPGVTFRPGDDRRLACDGRHREPRPEP